MYQWFCIIMIIQPVFSWFAPMRTSSSQQAPASAKCSHFSILSNPREYTRAESLTTLYHIKSGVHMNKCSTAPFPVYGKVVTMYVYMHDCGSLVPRPLPAFQHLQEKWEELVCVGTWSSQPRGQVHFETITSSFLTCLQISFYCQIFPPATQIRDEITAGKPRNGVHSNV